MDITRLIRSVHRYSLYVCAKSLFNHSLVSIICLPTFMPATRREALCVHLPESFYISIVLYSHSYKVTYGFPYILVMDTQDPRHLAVAPADILGVF